MSSLSMSFVHGHLRQGWKCYKASDTQELLLWGKELSGVSVRESL
jgi:hypothetical protein